MENISKTYIMIADAHLTGGNAERDLFETLKTISGLPCSCAVVFLGDIFEIWIGTSQYEMENHRIFMEWCRNEKSRGRELIFTEGNHEFLISKRRDRLFSAASRSDIRRGKILFTHGDRINRKDFPYLLLRIALRNWIARILLFIAGFTFGSALSHRIVKGLKGANLAHKKHLPEDQIRKYMKRAEKQGISTIFAGHFHGQHDLMQDGVAFHALPAFLNGREIGIYHTENENFQIIKCNDLKENTGEHIL